MSREQVFNSYETHPWLKRLYKRLSLTDRAFCVSFIRSNEKLDKGEFEYAVNRMFLDRVDVPKNWGPILELLMSANSAS